MLRAHRKVVVVVVGGGGGAGSAASRSMRSKLRGDSQEGPKDEDGYPHATDTRCRHEMTA